MNPEKKKSLRSKIIGLSLSLSLARFVDLHQATTLRFALSSQYSLDAPQSIDDISLFVPQSSSLSPSYDNVFARIQPFFLEDRKVFVASRDVLDPFAVALRLLIVNISVSRIEREKNCQL